MKALINLFKALFALLLLVGVEQLCKLKTRGFCIEKIKSDLPHNPDWEISCSIDQSQLDLIFDQPFYFLGSGHECYSFVSKDEQTVIKFFKLNVRYAYVHKALKMENPIFSVRRYWKKVKDIQRDRIHNTLESATFAYGNLKDETGIFYLHLNDTSHFNRSLRIQDNLGINYEVDLDRSKFLLQKKADPTISKLTTLLKNKRIDDAKQCVDSLLNLIMNRAKKGFADVDPNLETNFGFVGNDAIVIDSGSFIADDFHKRPHIYKKEILCQTFKLKLWLEKHSPELLNYFLDRINFIVQNE